MIEAFLYLLTGLLGIISFSIILINIKINRVVNIYLVILFYLLSIKFILDSMLKFEIFNDPNKIYRDLIPFMIGTFPCLYLYSKNTVLNSDQIYKRDLIHLLPSLLFGLTNIFWTHNLFPNFPIRYILHIVFFIYVITYMTMTFFKLQKGVWNRSSTISIVDNQNKLLIKWTAFLFFIGLFASIRLLASLFYDLSAPKSNLGLSFQWVSSVLFIILFIKILVSPEMLFGYNAYYKKMNDQKSKKFILVDLWILKESIKINNIQDEQLRSKVLLNLEENLIAIEDLVLNKKWFRNIDSKHNMMATELNIPKSHINYIFKYHSKVSFVEFRKIIRVYDSIQLIEEDFLKSNTLESLASKAGFSSYNPFFTAFKEVTAITPQAYNKKVQSLKKYN